MYQERQIKTKKRPGKPHIKNNNCSLSCYYPRQHSLERCTQYQKPLRPILFRDKNFAAVFSSRPFLFSNKTITCREKEEEAPLDKLGISDELFNNRKQPSYGGVNNYDESCIGFLSGEQKTCTWTFFGHFQATIYQ